jgi:hypothetical protein
MWWPNLKGQTLSPDEPFLCINFLYHPGGIFHRIKTAWGVIRKNKWQEEADMTIGGIGKVRELRDFLNKCLEQDEEVKEKEIG